MKIIKYKKIKGNIYEVLFDNNIKYNLYDDIIINHNLLAQKDIDSKLLEKILKENDELSSYYLALKYINIKMRSEKEIRNYLQKKDFVNSIINKTIILLRKNGYINENVYTSAFINDAINLSLDGPCKIKNKLMQLGIDESIIDFYLKQIDSEIWEKKVEKIISKKIKSNHNLSIKSLKLKITIHLQNNGYSKEMFVDLLNNIELENEEEIFMKEANKLKNKYANKFDNNKLKIYLKNKLYSKGFNLDIINSYIKKID